jgi:two-component system, OmpR family, sensor histidine kinase ChvG
LRVAGAPLHVGGSADRLAQAFENILSNARSFAPSGTPVDVDVRPEDGFCRVSIADKGPGIPSAHLDRVFDRFFTYRPAESQGRSDHAGLGLAIARTIVQGYGGTIAASNRAEGGACFDIRLPRIA